MEHLRLVSFALGIGVSVGALVFALCSVFDEEEPRRPPRVRASRGHLVRR
jgi:hypothetical protein